MVILSVISFYISKIIRYFRTKKIAKILTILGFVAILFAISRALYEFFHWGLVFVLKSEYMENSMVLFVFELFFLFFFFIVALSGFISGVSSLFKRYEDEWIVASPSFSSAFSALLLRVFSGFIIPFFVVGVPAILGAQSAFEFGAEEVFFGFALLFLSVAFSISTVLVLFFILAAFLRLVSLKFFHFSASPNFLTISLSLLFLLGCVMSVAYVANIDVAVLFQETSAGSGMVDIENISRAFKFAPSHLPAFSFYAFGVGDFSGGLSFFLRFLMVTLVSVLLLFVSSRAYLPLWQAFQEQTSKRPAPRRKFFPPFRFPRYFQTPEGVMFEKEAITMFRSIKNTLWVGFLFFIWVAQAALNIFLRRNIDKHGVDVGTMPEFLLALQIVVIVYFISAFSLRFAFPSFSMEKKAIWILGSAPVDARKIFWAKFFFFFSLFLTLALTVGFFNIAVLRASFVEATLFFVFIVVSVVFLTALGLGFGALFPNFETDDPQILSTTLPGVGFIITSLLYGGIGSFLVFDFLTSGRWVPLILFEVFSFCLVAFLLFASPRAIEKTEFISTRA